LSAPVCERLVRRDLLEIDVTGDPMCRSVIRPGRAT
jgi:hypothetical protein